MSDANDHYGNHHPYESTYKDAHSQGHENASGVKFKSAPVFSVITPAKLICAVSLLVAVTVLFEEWEGVFDAKDAEEGVGNEEIEPHKIFG